MSVANLADQRHLRHVDAHPAALETDRTALTASLLREKELLAEMSVLSVQQDLMAQEFDHLLMRRATSSSVSKALPLPCCFRSWTMDRGCLRILATARTHAQRQISQTRKLQ